MSVIVRQKMNVIGIIDHIGKYIKESFKNQ